MKVYSTKEVAEILKIHERTVLNEINRGNLEGKKIGNKFRITEQALKKYLNLTDTADPVDPEEKEEVVHTCREVAEILGVDVRTIQGYCNQGKIKTAFKNNKGHWRIPAEELKKLKEEAGQ